MATYAWGFNFQGDLGVGDTVTPHRTPTAVIDTVGFVDGGAGMFLAANGTVYFAGINTHGGFGDGTSGSAIHTTATQVPGLSGITRISGGAVNIYLALDVAGVLWGWGSNNASALALPATTVDQLTPTPINSGVVDFDSNGSTTIVLKAGGRVETVGSNLFGQLGTSFQYGITRVPAWQTVTPGSGVVTQVATGTACTLLCMQDGTVMAAGRNSGTANLAGQFGVTATTDTGGAWITLPYANAVAVWAFSVGTLIFKNDGTIWGMGQNDNGQLGVGFVQGTSTTDHVSTPTQWVTPASWATSGAGVAQHSPGISTPSQNVLGTDGLIYTWGTGTNGEMGDGGSTTANPTPASVNGLSGMLWTSCRGAQFAGNVTATLDAATAVSGGVGIGPSTTQPDQSRLVYGSVGLSAAMARRRGQFFAQVIGA